MYIKTFFYFNLLLFCFSFHNPCPSDWLALWTSVGGKTMGEFCYRLLKACHKPSIPFFFRTNHFKQLKDIQGIF